MKKLLLLSLAFVCLVGLSGCKHDNLESYYFKGVHDSFEINGCSLTVEDSNEIFKGGTLSIIQPELFENVVSCNMRFYILFEDDSIYKFRTIKLDDLSNGSELNGISLGNGGSTNGASLVELSKNFDRNFWFELITKDVNGIENIYQIQLELIK